jgi:hypothetical protein
MSTLPLDCERNVTGGKVQLTETHLLPHLTPPLTIYPLGDELTSTLKGISENYGKIEGFL